MPTTLLVLLLFLVPFIYTCAPFQEYYVLYERSRSAYSLQFVQNETCLFATNATTSQILLFEKDYALLPCQSKNCSSCSNGKRYRYFAEYFDTHFVYQVKPYFVSKICNQCPNATRQEDAILKQLPSSNNLACLRCSASVPCEPGYYWNEDAQLCESCAAGTFSSGGYCATCQACVPGTWSNDIASAKCQHCVAGTVSRNFFGTTCEACSFGTFASHNASYTCLLCHPGTYTNQNGTVKCQSCLAGSFGSVYGAQSCIPCPANTYSARTGAISSSTCLPCSVGHISNAGSARCEFIKGIIVGASSLLATALVFIIAVLLIIICCKKYRKHKDGVMSDAHHELKEV